MLILTRRVSETLLIGSDIAVTVLGVEGRNVRIGVRAPDHVNIVREEIASSPASIRAAKERMAAGPYAAGCDDTDNDPDGCVYRPDLTCECWVRLANGKNCPHQPSDEGAPV